MDLKKFDLEEKNKYENNVLHLSTYNNKNLDVIKYLIETKNVNPKTKDYDLNNLLQLAIFNKNIEIIKYLMSLNIFSLESKNYEKYDLFDISFSNHKIEFLSFFALSYPDYRFQYGNNLLHLICEKNMFDIFCTIVELQKINLTEKNFKGDNVLHFCGKKKKKKFLIFNFFFFLKSIFFKYLKKLIVKNKREKYAKIIFEKNVVDIFDVNKKGRNILHIIAQNEYSVEFFDYVYQIFKEKKPKENFLDKKDFFGDNLLHLSVTNNNFSLLKHLVKKVKEKKIDLDLKKKNKSGNNILHLSSSNYSIETLKFILNSDLVDIHEKNKDGNNALHLCVLKQSNRLNKIFG